MGLRILVDTILGRIILKTESGAWRTIKNSELLPIYYMIPDKIAVRMERQFDELLRMPAELLLDPKSLALVESDKFREHMCDAFAYLAWHTIGIKGWMELYSGYAPQWIIVHETYLWMQQLQKIKALWTNFDLFWDPLLHQIITFPTVEEAYEIVAMAKEPMMKLCDHGEIIKIANEMPCEEDFDFRRFENKRRANWRRSWYHMRTKHPTAFYDEIIRSPGSSDYQLLISSTSDISPEQIAIDREEGERFFRTLSLIDRKIILLRNQGYTLEETAKMVGFATHSAVLKRIRKIGKAYERFSGEDLGFSEKKIL